MSGPERRPVEDAAAFGRVAVLMGGRSSEREISLMTGRAVHAALLRRGVDACVIDAGADLVRQLLDGAYDRAWNALHGPGGEDGTVQGLLEYLGLPYTGSGVAASAIGMDKLRSKALFRAWGVETPDSVLLEGPADFQSAVAQLGLPLAVKPNGQGSSVGVTRVESAGALPAAFDAAARYGDGVFAEPWIAGAEYTAGLLQGEVLPLIRIEAAEHVFYDYDAKYFSDATRYHCPCGLPAEREAIYAHAALRAFGAIGGSGWGRVDFMVDEGGRALVLEVNTVPGMTDHSLVPMAARQIGIDFDELVWRILETSMGMDARRGSRA